MFSRLRPAPPRLAAFLFDLDGTLAETPIDFEGMRRSILDLAQSLGLNAEELRPYDILGMIERAEELLEGVSLPEPFREQAERELVRYEREAASVAKELPGAIETLTQLKARGFKVGIVTRNCRLGLNMALERIPLPHDLSLSRNEVRRAKPDPEHLLEAARQLGVAPEACAMVGDHPMDIQGGRAAGMFSIAVQTRDSSPDAFQSVNPDVILPSVGELLLWMSASSL
jgi:phosphoglycolate phosphatase